MTNSARVGRNRRFTRTLCFGIRSILIWLTRISSPKIVYRISNAIRRCRITIYCSNCMDTNYSHTDILLSSERFSAGKLNQSYWSSYTRSYYVWSGFRRFITSRSSVLVAICTNWPWFMTHERTSIKWSICIPRLACHLIVFKFTSAFDGYDILGKV